MQTEVRPQSALFVVSIVFLFSLLSSIPEVIAQTTQPEWRLHTPLPEALTGHRMVLLPTGDVLVCGGISTSGTAERSSYLYSSTTGSFRPTINQLNTSRAYHALVDLPIAGGRKVFAIGGFSGSKGNYSAEASIEVLEYDAGLNNWRWRPVGRLSRGRGDLRAVWDGSDHIVVTGGYEGSGGALRAGVRSSVAERVAITSFTVTPLPTMDAPRAEQTLAHITDENGQDVVLVAGGEANSGATATQILEGTLWNPIANPPLAYHSGGFGFGDPATIARTFGGFDANGVPSDACEWYDVKRGWRTAPRMNSPRARFDATRVAGISDSTLTYLAVAGQGTSGSISATELFYLPSSAFPNGSWTPFPALGQAGAERQTAIAGSNLPIVTGGLGSSGSLDGVEVFQPLRVTDQAFGDEEVGRRSDSIQLSIKNEWLLPVRLTNFRVEGSPAFFFRGDTTDFVIPAGGSRTIRLYFQPGSTGRHNGELVFEVGELTDRVKLTGNGIASTLAVINSPFDAGAVFLKQSRQFCFHALRNNGTDTAVIDSVSIDPVGTFRLISPKGRASIPPGDSLLVCLEFAPSRRGIETGVATIHLAGRAFPAQVIAQGVRRYLTASTITSECDTVIFAPETEISGFIRIENLGDSVVRTTLPKLTQSVAGLFRLADPSIFPLDLLPGESRLIEIIFSPARESRESVTVTFPNNGDTAAAVTLCFVARSRYLAVSQSDLNFGEVCTGDTITQTLLLENPGGFDTVELYSASLTPQDVLTLSNFSPTTLGPRQYVRLTITYAPQTDGPLSGTLTVGNSRGDLLIPISGNALPSARFRPLDTEGNIGGKVILPIYMEGLGAGNMIDEGVLEFSYDPTLLLPLGIVALNGSPAVDQGRTGVTISGKGEAQIAIAWGGVGLTTDGPAFGIEAEILRGDAHRSTLKLTGQSKSGFCLTAGEGEFLALPPCWGDGGFVRTGKVSLLFAAPKPASEVMTVTIVSPEEGEEISVEIVDALGNRLDEYRSTNRLSNTFTLTVDVRLFPPGLYFLRATAGEKIVGSTSVIIE
ncbi:MAG: choice-of-anchor D domain-containing protein [Ignavibacteriae bacterium]|nr:choice-of-anchor D domain-containing protein [Ignavibacteriota bacterium]MCB9214908.1 choice-of-anchor D domain-containing protein [Ignavibacteria bacterium]